MTAKLTEAQTQLRSIYSLGNKIGYPSNPKIPEKSSLMEKCLDETIYSSFKKWWSEEYPSHNLLVDINFEALLFGMFLFLTPEAQRSKVEKKVIDKLESIYPNLKAAFLRQGFIEDEYEFSKGGFKGYKVFCNLVFPEMEREAKEPTNLTKAQKMTISIKNSREKLTPEKAKLYESCVSAEIYPKFLVWFSQMAKLHKFGNVWVVTEDPRVLIQGMEVFLEKPDLKGEEAVEFFKKIEERVKTANENKKLDDLTL
jgi:hypothetical protein